MNGKIFKIWGSATMVALGLNVAVGHAEDKKLGWSGEAGLQFVAIDGNSKSQSLGFNGKAVYNWDAAAFVVETGGVRAESTLVTRAAVGTPTDFRVIESKSTSKTAENYFLRGRYDQEISKELVWFVGAGWERNQFAGFDSRASLIGGLGKIWIENDKTKFRTDVGLTYTREEPTASLIESTDYLGARLGWDFSHQLSANTKLSNVLALDANFDESEDWRADDMTTLSVAMSERLALQLGLRLLYDHQPGFQRIPLTTPSGMRRFVLVEQDDLDSTFTTSVVWKF